MNPPRDTPEQVDQLHALGFTRSVELNGAGLWSHPSSPGIELHGAANALAYSEGRPLPYPANPAFPWM